MKPRAFIGSSIEGLSIAYAVQQNLIHDVEITVWDQGVFELSSTTIESLSRELSENDFGIFVFSPDDLLKMRDNQFATVRDNVLFEFGLFIGRLGRERVFFLLPNSEELHLPSDLMRITAGRYDSKRSDGSMRAATGPVCHQMRMQIKSLGALPSRAQASSGEDEIPTPSPENQSWIQSFLDGRFADAIKILEEQLNQETGDNALNIQAWLLYCKQKLSNSTDLQPLLQFAAKNRTSSQIQSTISTMLQWEKHTDRAIRMLEAARGQSPKDSVIALAIAACHLEYEDHESAISELLRIGPDDFPEVAIELADIYEKVEKKNEALTVIQATHKKHPTNKAIRYKYARIAGDLNMTSVAIYLFYELCKEDPKSVEYWGYLGNVCLDAELYDQALLSYRRAESNMESTYSGQWIVSNIGNLFKNKGLPTEACIYLERAISKEPKSEYAHNRLSVALKNKDMEAKEFRKKCIEGHRAVREATSGSSSTEATT